MSKSMPKYLISKTDLPRIYMNTKYLLYISIFQYLFIRFNNILVVMKKWMQAVRRDVNVSILTIY